MRGALGTGRFKECSVVGAKCAGKSVLHKKKEGDLERRENRPHSKKKLD